MSIFLQRVGSQMTSSMGSTLLAITTSLAFLSSMSLVTWLRPNLRWKGLCLSTDFFSAFSLAYWVNLWLFCLLSSGEYFCKSLNKFFEWFLSKALENWAMVAGTFSLVSKILFCLWKVMYFGHFTNLVKFLLGWMLLPTLKFLGFFSKRGLAFFSTFLTALFPLAPLA